MVSSYGFPVEVRRSLSFILAPFLLSPAATGYRAIMWVYLAWEERMEGLDIQDRLEYARAAVAVLRALKIKDSTMGYGELARAIGLIPEGGRWEPWHRQQVADFCNWWQLPNGRAMQRLGPNRLISRGW
jgi:hypothetical protein